MLEWIWNVALAMAQEPSNVIVAAVWEGASVAALLGIVYGPRAAARWALVYTAVGLATWTMLASGAVLMLPTNVPS